MEKFLNGLFGIFWVIMSLFLCMGIELPAFILIMGCFIASGFFFSNF